MSDDLDNPAVLQANAWAGFSCVGELGEDALKWAVRGEVRRAGMPMAPGFVDLNDWTHPQVGWGVVLPERAGLDPVDKGAAKDAPGPIQELIKQRSNAPVFRYDPELAKQGLLRHYARTTGALTEPSLRGPRGLAPGAIPKYLLIVGTPAEIPWKFQYWLQTDAFVGRLDLDEQGLGSYVSALLRAWNGTGRNVARPVIWAVDHGRPDITRLMAKTIAERLQGRFASDAEFDSADAFFTGANATASTLTTAVANRQPAFLVTTSHGATFPLNDPIALAAQLGSLVDANHTLLNAGDVLNDWDSEGAIWYAHACCSAGAAETSAFAGLIDPTTTLGQTINAIGISGSVSAPLPKALLGHHKPLGAFIGHVEPTFNWTLYSDANQQSTTEHIVRTLYDSLHAIDRPTIGRAMSGYYHSVASLLTEHLDALQALNEHATGASDQVIRTKLIATDLLSMVLLGDPTVRLPLPKP